MCTSTEFRLELRIFSSLVLDVSHDGALYGKLGLFKRPGKKGKGALYGVFRESRYDWLCQSPNLRGFPADQQQRCLILQDHLPKMRLYLMDEPLSAGETLATETAILNDLARNDRSWKNSGS